MRVWKFLLPGLAAMLLLAGCASYHLGAVNGQVAGGQSIEIQPFNNQTMQPRLGDAVTQALRERVQSDGTCRLATSAPGDVVVSGVLREYHRVGMSFLNHDVATPQDFRVTLTAHVTVRSRATGKVLLERDVLGHTLINLGADMASSERQAAPLLAADLAQNIVSLITEGEW